MTLLLGVPTIYQLLADHDSFAATELSSVRDALCGGAPLPTPLLERFLERGILLRQGFGLTEVGPNCFSLPPDRVRSTVRAWCDSSRESVSRPLDNCLW